VSQVLYSVHTGLYVYKGGFVECSHLVVIVKLLRHLLCNFTVAEELTINVPVVYMGQDVWIWMGE
jgi:hypothetical protein